MVNNYVGRNGIPPDCEIAERHSAPQQRKNEDSPSRTALVFISQNTEICYLRPFNSSRKKKPITALTTPTIKPPQKAGQNPSTE